MNSPTFRQLQNEGFLIQSCFKSSIAALRKSSYSQRGPIYVSLFNSSIALERLLKVVLILHHHLSNAGGFPTKRALQQHGHNILPLYLIVERLFGVYGVKVSTRRRLDRIDKEFMGLLDHFAVSGRYFNLDALGGAGTQDPVIAWNTLLMKVYKKDVPRSQKGRTTRQVSGFSAATEHAVSFLPGVGLDGRKQSYRELCLSHAQMEVALPPVVWRLIKILIPLKDLLTAITERLHQPTFRRGEQIPFMEEFLDFVGPDKESTIGDADWPHWN